MKRLFSTTTASSLLKKSHHHHHHHHQQQIRLLASNIQLLAAAETSSRSAIPSTSPLASGDHQRATTSSAGYSGVRENRAYGEGFNNEDVTSGSASVNLDTLKERGEAQMRSFDKSKRKENVDGITHTMSPGQGTTSTGVNTDVQEEGDKKFQHQQVPHRSTGKGKRGLGWMASPFDRTFSDLDKNSSNSSHEWYKGRSTNPNDSYARANWPTGDAGFVDNINDSTYYENNTKAGPISHGASKDVMQSRYMVGAEAGDAFLAFDFVEHPTTYELVADLPGFKRQNISVDCNEKKGVLTVKAKKDAPTDTAAPIWYRSERNKGKSYYRVIPIPDDVNYQAVSAYYKDGELKITLPKTEESLEGNSRAVHVSDDPSVHYGACSGSYGGA